MDVEEGESFVLERSFDDSEGWVLIKDWVRSDQGFQNENGRTEATVIVSTNDNERVQFCFRSNGSDNSDKIYIDDVIVSRETYVVFTAAPYHSGFNNLALNKPTEQSGVLQGEIYLLAVDGNTGFDSCIVTKLRG